MNICLINNTNMNNIDPELFKYDPKNQMIIPKNLSKVILCDPTDIRSQYPNLFECDYFTGKYRIKRSTSIYNTFDPKPAMYYQHELEYRKYEKYFDNINSQAKELLEKIKKIYAQKSLIKEQFDIIQEKIESNYQSVIKIKNNENEFLTKYLDIQNQKYIKYINDIKANQQNQQNPPNQP